MRRRTVRHLKQERHLDPSLGFRIARDFQKQGLNFWHDHDFYEIAIITEGSGEHKTLRRKHRVRKGDVLFFNTGEAHCYLTGKDEGIHLVNVLFSQPFLKPLLLSFGEWSFIREFHLADFVEQKPLGFHSFRLPSRDFIAVRDILERMLEAYKKRDTGFEIFLRIKCQELLFYLGRSHESRRSKSDAGSPRLSPTQEKIHRVLDYMGREFAKTLELKQLADLIHANPSYFSRAFKQVTGFAPFEYLNDLRIQKACALLKETSSSVKEVGHLVGFQNDSLFFRMFKRHTGMSPRAYRVIT